MAMRWPAPSAASRLPGGGGRAGTIADYVLTAFVMLPAKEALAVWNAFYLILQYFTRHVRLPTRIC